MPNVLDHLTRSAMCLRGCRRHRVPTAVGEMAALTWPGRGPHAPVAIVHGWASAGVHHVLSARSLLRHTRAIALPDLPGHGFSEVPSETTPHATEVGLRETLDAVLHEPAVVVGSSLGGLAAVRYALARPERVRSLVLVSPFGAPMAPDALRVLVDACRARSLRDTKAFLDRLSVRPQRRNWLFAPEMRRILTRPHLQALLDAATSAPLLEPADLEALEVPVTVVWGRHEALLPSEHLAFWRQGPTVRVVRPPHSGHSPAFDEPRVFERIVREHLESAP